MGSTTYRPTLREVDSALQHGNVAEAERMLRESNAHPLTAAYRFREALIALANNDPKEADYCFEEARGTGNLSPADEARYLRHAFRSALRHKSPNRANTILEQLAGNPFTVEGWLLSRRGQVAYLEAICGSGKRTEWTAILEKAATYFSEAETHWGRHECAQRCWQINNRWWWFKTEWRLMKAYHRSGGEHIRRLDNLRWDVIDNDPSGFRQLIAHVPWLLFGFAEKA